MRKTITAAGRRTFAWSPIKGVGNLATLSVATHVDERHPSSI